LFLKGEGHSIGEVDLIDAKREGSDPLEWQLWSKALGHSALL